MSHSVLYIDDSDDNVVLGEAVMGGEDPVHRPGRAQVGALVQQRRVGLLRRDVDEPLGVQHLEHSLTLGL